MALIVQKFGGTSVANIEYLNNVADRILLARENGHQVVVVVSAMGKETDRLVELAKEAVTSSSTRRELLRRETDVLLSTGEQVTIALLSMILINRGQKAKSYTGSQIRIVTDSSHTRARIQEIQTDKILHDLEGGSIVVVAAAWFVT